MFLSRSFSTTACLGSTRCSDWPAAKQRFTIDTREPGWPKFTPSPLSILVLVAAPSLMGCSRLTEPRAAAQVESVPLQHFDRQTLLVPATSRIDLGVVPPRGQREYAFWLENPSDSPVPVNEIETSCDCLHVDVPRRAVPAKGKAVAIIQLDLAHDKESVGNLGIEVRGYATERRLAFRLTVDVSILPEQDFLGK